MERQPAEQAQEGVTADRQPKPLAEPYTRRPTQSQSDVPQPVEEALGPPGPGGDDLGSRSVKIRRVQRPLAQKNFRTLSCHTTRQWAHGRSAIIRL